MVMGMSFKARNHWEKVSIQFKKVLTKMILVSAGLALYFYWRHNEFCEPFVYSFFALSEYSIVLCNMVYHWLAAYDFHDFIVCLRCSKLSVQRGNGRGSDLLWS